MWAMQECTSGTAGCPHLLIDTVDSTAIVTVHFWNFMLLQIGQFIRLGGVMPWNGIVVWRNSLFSTYGRPFMIFLLTHAIG